MIEDKDEDEEGSAVARFGWTYVDLIGIGLVKAGVTKSGPGSSNLEHALNADIEAIDQDIPPAAPPIE